MDLVHYCQERTKYILLRVHVFETNKRQGGDFDSVVEHSPCMCDVLGLGLNTEGKEPPNSKLERWGK